MKTVVLRPVLLGSLALLALAAAPVWAAQCGTASVPPKAVCECGDEVVGDYVFPDHLACPADGLAVSAASTVDLNGFRLSGTDYNGTGLKLIGSGGTVGGGLIQNFDTGIRTAGSSSSGWKIGTAGPLTVTDNFLGVFLSVDDGTIVDTAVTANLTDGLDVFGNHNTIARITCSRNGGTGIDVGGNANVLDHNRCERNRGAGIGVSGTHNVLIRNLATRNGSHGVEAFGTGNAFESNQGTHNRGTGVRGVGGDLATNGRNYGAGNGGANCLIEGHTPTGGGRYC